MTGQWVVLLNTGTDIVAYGPLEQDQARVFAEFLTATVDPATPFRLRSSTAEVLGWWRSETDRNNCTGGSDCEVHPGTVPNTWHTAETYRETGT